MKNACLVTVLKSLDRLDAATLFIFITPIYATVWAMLLVRFCLISVARDGFVSGSQSFIPNDATRPCVLQDRVGASEFSDQVHERTVGVITLVGQIVREF
jgi:hypothetical protein